jgi:ATP-binding cassette, subfamily B, bacterial
MSLGRAVSTENSPGIRLLSATRGRERWEVKAIGRKPTLARELEDNLLEYPGVRDVTANPVTSRVLVLYEPDTVGLHVESLLLDGLRNLDSKGLRKKKSVSSNGSSLTRVIKLALPDRKKVAKPAILSIVGHLVGVVLGLCFVGIFNTASGEGFTFLKRVGLTSKTARIIFMTGVSMLLIAAELLTRNRRKKAWRKLALEAQHNLRRELILRIERQDMAFFDKEGTGSLIKLITEDTTQIKNFVERAGDETVELGMIIGVYGGLLAITSPGLALVTLFVLPFIVMSSRFFAGKARDRYAISGQASGAFTQMLENNLTGIADVKSFTAEQQETLRLAKADLRLADASLEAVSVSAIQAQLNFAFTNAGFFLTAAYGGHLASSGKITQGQYFLAAAMFPALVSALKDVDQVTGLYHGAVNSAEQLTAVLDAQPSIRSGPVRLPRGTVRGEIVFENVSFGYDPAVKVLKNVSFNLQAGETIAIVGPTGSGKSTLLNLILRFYDVDSGRILLDGREIRDVNLGDLRAAVSVVSQDVHLFQGSVRENLLYGNPRATDDEILEALRDAQAINLLDNLPGGMEAEVGERGQRLSGGERQRVAIARALLKLFGGAAVLALDEATSQLDNETEAGLKRSLRKAASGRGVIIIAHRLSTIRSADRILVLERGEIIEEGTHETLLAGKGLYASLWQLQNEDPLGALEVRIT